MSIIKHTTLLFLPIGLSVLSVACYLEMQTAHSKPTASEVTDSKVSPFTVLDYPENVQMVQLPREWPSAEFLADDSSSQERAANSKSGTQTFPAQREDVELSLDDIDLSSLSPDLAMKVENVLSSQSKAASHPSLPLNDLEENTQRWQGRLPALNLQTHMYASDTKRRWVKINNVEYHQGEVVDGQVTLKEILPQAVIVEFQGEQIRIPALYEWQG